MSVAARADTAHVEEELLPAPLRRRQRGLRWWKEVLYVLAFYLVYSAIRNTQGSASVSAQHALHDALHIIRIEKALGIFHERALQDAADTNPAVLNTRLKELRAAGLVDHDEGGYRLTDLCVELQALLMPLNAWAERWASTLDHEAAD